MGGGTRRPTRSICPLRRQGRQPLLRMAALPAAPRLPAANKAAAKARSRARLRR